MAAAAAAATTSCCSTKLVYLSSPIPVVSPPKSRCTMKMKMAASNSKSKNCLFVEARFGTFKTGGAGVIEKPAFDQSQFDPSTQVLEGGDIGKMKDKRGTGSGDSYRVLLIDDTRHSEKLVAKVLPQVVPSITPDDARKLFHESREHGMAIVIVTVKEHAEFYAQMMVRGGLRSTIEPDSSTL
ncbi:ClpS domain-containing protein [Citrus sinensis]|uniref:ClpS domain-containing protein n=1 Tax=Citrus sinensis TaxID=2711 RepID=A0ACB8LDQ9_CITSI|nr:ClpS domain-containing protein [Citrus sinensis]